MLSIGGWLGFEYSNDTNLNEIGRLKGIIKSYEEFHSQVELERQERLVENLRQSSERKTSNVIAFNQNGFCTKNKNTKNRDLIMMMKDMCN